MRQKSKYAGLESLLFPVQRYGATANSDLLIRDMDWLNCKTLKKNCRAVIWSLGMFTFSLVSVGASLLNCCFVNYITLKFTSNQSCDYFVLSFLLKTIVLMSKWWPTFGAILLNYLKGGGFITNNNDDLLYANEYNLYQNLNHTLFQIKT